MESWSIVRCTRRYCMSLKILRFFSLVFTSMALIPIGAHLLELPLKFMLDINEYMLVQQLFKGVGMGILFGICALLTTLALTVMERKDTKAFVLSGMAFVALCAVQLNFWIFQFPLNRTTQNWSHLPIFGWQMMRNQWEMSNAFSAMLTMIAFLLLS